jgi:hypothetical protein
LNFTWLGPLVTERKTEEGDARCRGEVAGGDGRLAGRGPRPWEAEEAAAHPLMGSPAGEGHRNRVGGGSMVGAARAAGGWARRRRFGGDVVAQGRLLPHCKLQRVEVTRFVGSSGRGCA